MASSTLCPCSAFKSTLLLAFLLVFCGSRTFLGRVRNFLVKLTLQVRSLMPLERCRAAGGRACCCLGAIAKGFASCASRPRRAPMCFTHGVFKAELELAMRAGRAQRPHRLAAPLKCTAVVCGKHCVEEDIVVIALNTSAVPFQHLLDFKLLFRPLRGFDSLSGLDSGRGGRLTSGITLCLKLPKLLDLRLARVGWCRGAALWLRLPGHSRSVLLFASDKLPKRLVRGSNGHRARLIW
mmetsp:Transcript_26500/g.84315  ORF Transcript_26500/g.84315 Transcript_26500/m.84315 type:complete len:238 (-) Transcript_26500:568-1281(-)